METTISAATAGIPIRCKAAICRKAGEALVIEEIEVAPPKAYEVRIKILCTSVCHTDITFWRISENLPRIFGHEAIGVVESVGDNVEEFKEGDHVVPCFLADCKECVDCNSEKSNMCSQFPFTIAPGMVRDGTSRFKTLDGEAIYDFLFVSSFTEYTVVDVTHLVKVTPEIAIDKACLLSCGISTGVGAAWKVAGVHKGSSVAIFGLGTVGLAVAEGARLCGASKIIGIDLNSDKFEIGKTFGLTHFINPKECGAKPVNEIIKEMTNGGADYCFECIGLASLMNDAFNSSREGWGKTVILGVEMHGAPLSVSAHDILKGRTITGTLFGGIKHKTDVPILAKRYIDNELHLDEFITQELNFQDINKAFDLLIQGKSLRCIIWMDK